MRTWYRKNGRGGGGKKARKEKVPSVREAGKGETIRLIKHEGNRLKNKRGKEKEN